jgi:hypothetical protein
MARSTAEIKAEIAVTRGLIETQLDAVRRRLPDRWWTQYAVLAGALVAGVALSRVPLLRLVGTGARVVEAGLTVATTVSTVNRFIAERPRHRKAA